MFEMIEFLVDDNYNGKRLDVVISLELDGLTRSYVQKLIENKCVKINEKIVISKNFKVKNGQVIKINVPVPENLNVEPENIPLEIVYEDEDLLIVNKRKGMVVHPAPGNYSGTLVNALMYHCGERLSTINGVIRPGIVHRIDKDTSGLLIIAKNDLAHKSLAEQIKNHSFSRKYEAVVYGNLKNDKGTINEPIGRHKINRKKMTVTKENSKTAITHYTIIERLNGFTHVGLKLETGRTHQIRVHMSYIGHPVAGDSVYGPKQIITELNGQCLHAKSIGFVHPKTMQYIEFESDLPDYFKKFLEKFKIK